MKIKYIAMFVFLTNMAHATVVLTSGNAGSLNNVLTNGSGAQTGSSVFGTVNGHTTNFTDSSEQITAQGGQAKVGAVDGLINSDLTFSIPGFTFTLIEFNPELTGDHKPAGSTLTITAYGFNGANPETIINTKLLGNGENRFYLTAGAGEKIQSVKLSGGSGYTDLKQVRVGALTAFDGGGGGGVGIEAVPEPGTYLLLGWGVLAIFVIRRRFRA